jgi:hypothetical protein
MRRIKRGYTRYDKAKGEKLIWHNLANDTIVKNAVPRCSVQRLETAVLNAVLRR